ncbi:MAG: hypothetical protein ACI9XK_000939, partial [Granulosicoccus sp.]
MEYKKGTEGLNLNPSVPFFYALCVALRVGITLRFLEKRAPNTNRQ